MKMKNNKKIFALMLFLIINIGYAQQDFIFRGIITDANSNLPLPDVRIYRINAGDTLKSQCNSNGEFQLSLNVGSRLLLKKSGYAWQIVRITNNDLQQIKLIPSKQENSEIILYDLDDKRKEGEVDFYFNGQLVQKTEWADALSIDPNEIRGVGVRDAKLSKDGRHKFYIETK